MSAIYSIRQVYQRVPLEGDYQRLAQLRRIQQGKTADDLELYDCIAWEETPEGSKFWESVHDGESPEIPAASLAEINAAQSAGQNNEETTWTK